jgi:hypothetical protein
MPPSRLASLAIACASALLFAGCSMWGFGDKKPETTAATTPTGSTAVASAEAKDEEIDVRRYLGPNYCPELRVVSGAELMRQYERGHADDPKFVIWQASVGKTARECLWDLEGGLTLKIGVSGRVIAGPKGGASTVSVPLKIAVVKHKEAVLANEKFSFDTVIPAAGAGVFTQVKDILVPSPGQDRDYIIYVGLDVGDWNPMTGELATVAVVEEPPPLPAEEPPLPAEPPTPSVLPTPDDGFVLQ